MNGFTPKELLSARNSNVDGLPAPSRAPPPSGSEVATGPVGPHPKKTGEETKYAVSVFQIFSKIQRQIFISLFVPGKIKNWTGYRHTRISECFEMKLRKSGTSAVLSIGLLGQFG